MTFTAPNAASSMPFYRSIGARIFGLAVFLSLLAAILTGFMLWEMTLSERDIRTVANVDMPLSNAMAQIDYLGVRRRLAFERWFGALNAASSNQTIIDEASANYEKFAAELRQEAERTQMMLENYPAEKASNPKIIEVKLLFRDLVAVYPVMTKRQQEALQLQLAGDHIKANEHLNFVNDMQLSIVSKRERMKNLMEEISSDEAHQVADRQQRVLWIALAATVSVVMLGLLVAWIITRRLTTPLRSLVTAMDNVQHGNLDAASLPVLSPDEIGLLTGSFNYFVDELRAKEQIKRTFGKYIDPRVLDRVLQQSSTEVEVVSKRVMTVSFADLVGFTGLSERLTPPLMVAVLNRHFGLQAQMVHDYQGIVDKFIGDALMAFWGPPFVTAEEHALLACRAALAQIKIIEAFRQELPDLTGLRKDAPNIDLRIGVCTGEMVVGNIGSERTRSYTVIGDTVNLSSRLEGANRIYGTHILIGEPTYQAVAGQMETREIDSIAVKGRSDPTRIYELLGEVGTVSVITQQLRDRYVAALTAYRAQAWDTAEQGFNDCLQLQSDDGPSRVFLDRITKLRSNPPSLPWDGVWKMAEK